VQRASTWLVLGLSAGGCLPADTRPLPGRALVSVHASDSLLDGITAGETEDGWAIEYQRVLLGLGRVNLGGDRCTTYSDADYTRLFDMLLPGAQKVSEQYALGACDFNFGVVPPSAESLLGRGVSEADAVFMRTPAGDAALPARGISIHVEGRATRGRASEHFAWSFRWRVAYRDCAATLDGERVSGLQLASGDEQEVEIQISGEALFRDDPDPELGKLRFAALAAADQESGNADGEVSLDELRRVKLANLPGAPGYQRLGTADPPDLPPFVGAEPTLEDYLYVSGFPGVARFRDTGSCDTRVRARDQFEQ
jgi:hypothetical protein